MGSVTKIEFDGLEIRLLGNGQQRPRSSADLDL